MDGLLITILIVTGFLVYKMISSSRKQEGYKRWKATGSGDTANEETAGNKWKHGAWLRHALGVTTPKARTEIYSGYYLSPYIAARQCASRRYRIPASAFHCR